MESILQGICVVVYIDDILVSGNGEAGHLEKLDEVLTRLEDAGLRLKQDKCSPLSGVFGPQDHCRRNSTDRRKSQGTPEGSSPHGCLSVEVISGYDKLLW